MPKPSGRFLSLCLIAVALIFGGMHLGSPTRVGDGSQYLAMFFALEATGLPFVNPSALTEYERFRSEDYLAGMVPGNVIQATNERLNVGGGFDTQHFWAYSGAAALISRFLELSGYVIAPSQAFMLLHLLVFFSALVLCFRLHALPGFTAIALLVLVSPTLWFFNKIHTELITVCISVCALALFSGRLYLSAAAMFAVLSLQNPPFALLVPVILIFQWFSVGTFEMMKKWISILGLFLLCALHPFYYWSRHGSLTPQFVMGSASEDISVSAMILPLFDLDIGLFIHWPLGFLILGISALTSLRLGNSPFGLFRSRTFFYSMVLVLVISAAQSMTVNLNHGGTVSISRYALWYICLFYAPLRYLLSNIHLFHEKKVPAGLSLAAFIIAGSWNTFFFLPDKAEDCCTPTYASIYVQENYPELYDPPYEIFKERFGGFGEGIYGSDVNVVFTPSCNKALLLDPSSNTLRSNIPCLSAKGFDQLTQNTKKSSSPKYVFISRDFRGKFGYEVELGKEYRFGSGDFGEGVTLPDGWSIAETWGTWSDGKKASINLWLPGSEKELSVFIEIMPFAHPQHPQQRLIVNGACVRDQTTVLDKKSVVEISVSFDAESVGPRVCKVLLGLPDAASPTQLGMSADDRLLGIGLISLRVEPN